MRRYLLPALMISLLLTGCGGTAGPERRVKEQCETLAAAEELCLTADVTANLGSEVFRCTLRCTAVPEETTVEVLAPESVAGIRAVLRDDGAALEYGTASLGLAAAGLEGLSPVSAMPLLCKALQNGFLQRCWTERDGERTLIAAQLYVSDDAALTVWYDAGTMTPLHGEFSRDGALLLNCEISEFLYR